MRSLLIFSVVALLGCTKASAPAAGIAYPGGQARKGPPPVLDQFLPLAKPTLTAPPPPPIKPTLAFGGAPFGGTGAVIVERAASDASWVAVCEASSAAPSVGPRGELTSGAFVRKLLTPNEQLTIDDFLLADSSGRYVLFVQGGVLVLWDRDTQARVDLSALGADARLSAESFAEVRTLDFDAESRRLLYVRNAGDTAQRVVIRTLADGSELELDAGAVPIWRARFAPGSAYIALEVLREDTNKNGKLGFPAPLLTAPRPCSAAPGRYHVFAERGDNPVRELLPVIGGAPIQDPELVMALGDGWLLRDSAGALTDVRANKRRVLEPAACRGRIVHADPQRDLYIVGCAQKKTGRMLLEVVSRGERKSLDVDLASVELDHEPNGSPRLIPLYPGSNSGLFDTERRELLPLNSGDTVLAVHGTRALVKRAKSLLFYDAESRTEQALPGTIERFPELLVTATFVWVAPLLVNLEAGSIIERNGVRPLALSRDGRMLVAKSHNGKLDVGPLQWLAPSDH